MNADDYKIDLWPIRKEHFTTRYYYKHGKVVCIQRPGGPAPSPSQYNVGDSFVDIAAYEIACEERSRRRQQELDRFKVDLFKIHGVEDNLKRELCYELAEEFAEDRQETIEYFQDLVRLIK